MIRGTLVTTEQKTKRGGTDRWEDNKAVLDKNKSPHIFGYKRMLFNVAYLDKQMVTVIVTRIDIDFLV